MAFIPTQADIDALKALIRARIDGEAVESYAIAGRNLKFESISELQELLDRWCRVFDAANRPSGLPASYIVPGRSR